MKEIGLRIVRNPRSLLQRDKRIVFARVDHVRARKLLLDQIPQPQRHIEAQIFFHQTVRADRSRVVAAVAGIDHDAADFQSERTRQRAVAVARGLWLRGRHERGSLGRRISLSWRRRCLRRNLGCRFCRRRGVGRARRGIHCHGLAHRGRRRSGVLHVSRFRNRRRTRSALRCVHTLCANIDHKPIGIRKQKRRIVFRAIHVQHQADDARLVLPDANGFQQPTLHVERFGRELGVQFGFVDVEVNAVGRSDARGIVFDRVVQRYDDAR